MKLRALFILSVFLTIPAMANDTFEIWLWGNSNASMDKRILEISDHHACTGKIVKVSVKRMPLPDEALEGEKVIEVSIDGKIINIWYMPVDEIVLGVEGSSIITGYCNSTKALKIGTDGKLSSVSAPSCENNLRECPEVAVKEFPNSAYLRCFEYKDLHTGEKRLLAYQGPCT